jgi:hypothetical protein
MADYEYRGHTLHEWREMGRRKLEEQRVDAERFTEYYEGTPIGITLSGNQREIFRRLLRECRANWCELVISAVAERLHVVGFRFGDEEIDNLAWLVWQASQMDADHEMVQTDALVCGHSYVSIWPDEDNPSGVVIFPEHPTQVTCFYDPPDRRNVIVAYKHIEDEDTLTFPDLVAHWYHGGKHETERNELGVVPYEELVPNPRTLRPGRSELQSAISFQDRINTGVYNRLVAEDFGAFRQVTATGIALTRTIEGAYEAPFDVGADRLLVSENADARFGVIPESTLSGYLAAEDADVSHLAAITQTPPHYLLGKIANLSASALKAAETGLVAKVRRRAAHLGEGWERVIRRALYFVGSPGALEVQAETVWRDFESRTEGELVDALMKMSALGVPREVLWEKWGASPQDVERWRDLAEEEEADMAEAAAQQAAALAAETGSET